MSDLTDKREESKKEIINKLCILMMVSDRKITNDEIIIVVEIMESLAYFNISNSAILDLIDSVDHERNELGIPAMIEKYASFFKNKLEQENIVEYLESVMNADGIKHPKELEMLKILKTNWSS
jgi:uncharacterized tellurite resistance protein B-like protein